RGLESLLYHHRHACVVVLSETIELDFFKESFLKDGYKVAVAMPNLDELLKDTPTHVFTSAWFEWRKTKYYSTHYSELVRLAALYKYGGIYLDSDIVVLKPLSSLSNSVGMESSVKESFLNGAVMVFRRHSRFLMECMKEFYMTYDDTRLRWNGADLLTRVATKFLKEERNSIQELELKGVRRVKVTDLLLGEFSASILVVMEGMDCWCFTGVVLINVALGTGFGMNWQSSILLDCVLSCWPPWERSRLPTLVAAVEEFCSPSAWIMRPNSGSPMSSQENLRSPQSPSKTAETFPQL
ncbi:hypothetical protein TorRG33x02_339950, partial [Trema orientale]